MPLNPGQLVGTSLTPIQSLQTTAPMQSLTSNPGSLPSMSVETAVLNSGTPSAIVSLPQSFCFPNNQIGNCNISSGVTVTPNHANNGGTQLNAVSIGSVFGVTTDGLSQQFVQPLTIPQQQSLALPVNQQQQQTQQLSVPHALTLGQGMSLVSQSVPLGQVVCSTVATPLSFMNPTIFTMSSAAGQQNQYISNSFAQFPVVLGNQQSIFTGINAALTSHPIENVPVSQVSRVSQTAHIEMTNCLGTGHLSSNSVTVGEIPSNPASLSSQPVSVFSFGSPTLSIATSVKPMEASSQPSPDTTIASQSVHIDQSCSQVTVTNIDTTNLVTSSTHASFIPCSVASVTPFPELDLKKESQNVRAENYVTEKVDAPQSSVPKLSVCRARMKFTPVDAENRASSVCNNYSDNVKDEYDDMIDNAAEDDYSASGLLGVDDRVSPEDHFQSLHVKLEPYEHDDDEPDDASSKHSTSPIDSLEVARDADHQGSKTKINGQGDLTDEFAPQIVDGHYQVDDLDEAEFVWEDYLRETGSAAVPPTAFKHVEISLQSGFSKGMKLEAPNKHNPNTYWIATIVMTCGPLLRLRYEGYNDNSSADFWSDPMTSDVHPIGWCEENNKILQPPEGIQEKYPNWQEFLSSCLDGAARAPQYLLDKSTGATPVDQIRESMKLEIQDELRPNHLWLVKIMENIGGRLCLRYEGIDGDSNDLWLFYLDERLHPIGWCKQAGYHYSPPSVVKVKSNKTEKELMKILDSSLTDAVSQNLPADIYHDQHKIQHHRFEVGMKLEAVDRSNGYSICPATVTEVIDSKYFIIEIDSLIGSGMEKRSQFCCHRNTPTIFPVNWAASRSIKLASPLGWPERDFRWDDYLKSCKAAAAPSYFFNLCSPEHEFECGMKLEAVKPSKPTEICAATITNIVEHLMWIHLDSSKRMLDSHVESINSLNLFPVGWCVSVGYQLLPPCRMGRGIASRRRIAVVQPEIADNQIEKSQNPSTNGKELFGGPQIYFNHRCFSGPYLNKGRISELPRSVGPGPVALVMKEVLTLLINTAYKSSRVLKELQLEGMPRPGMTQQLLKAKYKGKSYRAWVEICCTAGQLEEFCRRVCLKLECCPNLMSPYFVNDICSENCAYYYGKRKKKIGRPPGGHSNLEKRQKKPDKHRKRKKLDTISKKSKLIPHDHEENIEDDKASICSDTKTVDSTSTSGSKERTHCKHAKGSSSNSITSLSIKRRYTHHIPPPSDIRTRGAKLPKYSFEKRTHKKIMIVEGSQQSLKPRKETIKPSHLAREVQCMVESSFTCTRPDMPVTLKSEPPLKLEKNPIEWSISDVGEFLQTTDCADKDLVARLRMEEIDGQALLLLTLPNVQEYMGIKLGPAIKLCHLIERIKIAFYETFAK
ncbi:hypothetical protein BsWGS_12177 [Bradybaena similaris]